MCFSSEEEMVLCVESTEVHAEKEKGLKSHSPLLSSPITALATAVFPTPAPPASSVGLPASRLVVSSSEKRMLSIVGTKTVWKAARVAGAN